MRDGGGKRRCRLLHDAAISGFASLQSSGGTFEQVVGSKRIRSHPSEALPYSTSANDMYPAANDSVQRAISECWSARKTNDAYTIAGATSIGMFEITGFPPTVYTTNVLSELQAAAPSDTSLFNNIRALGTALAPTPLYAASIREMIKNYSQNAEASGELAEIVYPLVADLAAAFAPYDAQTSADALRQVAASSAGIADEMSWTMAIELAPYAPEVVDQYISNRASQQIPHIAAIALAGYAPERAKRLQTTASPFIQKWIDAALYPASARSIAALVAELTNDANSNTLDTLGAELMAALLISGGAR